MRELMFLLAVFVTCVWCEPQVNRPARIDHGRGFDIRLAVPGQPGTDYPTLANIPRTSFSCSGKKPGYYADLETNCQVFRVCTRGSTYGFQSFVCPNGTLFNQAVFVCDWWMNVRCEKSQEMFNQNNEKFGNLKLGPQLMQDIKKMITYPMRNPYDRNTMNGKLVVMQEYIPPNGQMVMTGSRISDTDRLANFLPLKQNLVQNGFNNDISFASSTPSSLYVPATYNTIQSDAEVFQRQRQRQNGQYNHRAQSNQNIQSANSGSNGQSGKLVQSQYQQNGFQQNTQYMQSNYFRNAQTYNTQQNSNQAFRQAGQYSNGKPAKLVSAKQTDYGVTNSRQQYYVNPTQSKEQYTYKTPVPQFTNEFNGPASNDAKQNLELVYKFIQDSLNVAKEYSNIAQQNPSQFQNLNNEDLAQITNKISQLTASQYSGNNFNSANLGNVITSTAIAPNTDNHLQQLQSTQFSIEPSQQTAQEQLAAQVQNAYNQHIQSNQNQVYSGQLYQLPVPDVTNQLYSGNSAEINNAQNTEIEHLQQEISSTQSSPDVEIIQSQSVPVAPAKLQQAPTDLENFNSQENTQAFIQSILNSGNGIAAQVQDKIVGTIPHPSADNKQVTYKNDKSYYVITRNNNLFNENSNQNAKIVQNNIPNVVTFQLIPSVSYQLEDEKDQQRILNAFSIDEYGNPRNLGKTSERLTADVNYSVNHPTQQQLNSLYSGPSSYSAPQASVGRLDLRNPNSRLEQFDDNDDNGYGKVTPSIKFTF